MKIIGKIIKIGKKLKDRTIYINKFHGKIVIHNARPDTFVEILTGFSDEDRTKLGRYINDEE